MLKGKEFGPLKNQAVPLLCGGTVVFDENANFRYWVNKPGTEFQLKKKPEEQQKGERRKQELMDYVAACAAKGDKEALKDFLSGRFVTRV